MTTLVISARPGEVAFSFARRAPRRSIRLCGVVTCMADTGGAQRHPGDTERIMRYWASGPGAAKIGWGTAGDFGRCERLIQEAVTKGGHAPLPENEIAGLCANLHHRATGFWPGHAPGEQR